MSSEIFWLTLSAVNTALLVYIYAPPRVRRIGLKRVFTDPLPGDDPFPEGQEWAHRAYRAHMNAVENLVVFAPLAIAVYVTGASNEVTTAACATYFWARLLHGPLYVVNTPYVRFPLYMIALAACLVLAWELLAWSA
ncbi:MAG: MAPEG family protein [Pseudomonadota bacterium]